MTKQDVVHCLHQLRSINQCPVIDLKMSYFIGHQQELFELKDFDLLLSFPLVRLDLSWISTAQLNNIEQFDRLVDSIIQSHLRHCIREFVISGDFIIRFLQPTHYNAMKEAGLPIHRGLDIFVELKRMDAFRSRFKMTLI